MIGTFVLSALLVIPLCAASLPPLLPSLLPSFLPSFLSFPPLPTRPSSIALLSRAQPPFNKPHPAKLPNPSTQSAKKRQCLTLSSASSRIAQVESTDLPAPLLCTPTLLRASPSPSPSPPPKGSLQRTTSLFPAIGPPLLFFFYFSYPANLPCFTLPHRT
ncbi:unnamed protein product [Tuber aestivum]|uniref:REJ domain-containing protein n=1 Tax=Tuber aestivum TaxID=59557 RepID=A0A292PLY1_9PEZI|nr:unnamed protein product [Tuber aestivum]